MFSTMTPTRKAFLLFLLFLVAATAASVVRADQQRTPLPAGGAPFQQQSPARLNSEPILPPLPFEYANVSLPTYFTYPPISSADNTPVDNPITNDGATLGRVLFYDPRLSVNDTISCSSCHEQAHGFSDPDQFSTGFGGGLTARNSMALANNRYYARGHFFSDERAATLEAQALMPIQDPVEMGMTLPDLELKLATASFYPALFDAAFGTPDVTSERISLALAQFMRAMISYQSPFDVAVQNGYATLTAEEALGMQIFTTPPANCNQCHITFIQIADQPRNIGLDVTTPDPGAGDGTFKIPSLRNVELTAPYMHDGRFATLEEVVDFYDSGVQPHPNLDPLLEDSNGDPLQLNLTPEEKEALVAFLKTLTDTALTTDPRFANPFLPPVLLPVVIARPLE